MIVKSESVVKATTHRDPPDRLRQLVSELEPGIRRAFIEAITNAQSSISLARLERLLLEGRIEELLQELDSVAARIAATSESVLIVSAQRTAGVISRALGVLIDFDQTNDRAISVLRNNKFNLIREFTRQQREAVQQALVDGTTAGLNPRSQARNLRGSIGLTRRQQAAVGNFRLLLRNNDAESLTRALRDKRFDPSIIRAIDTKTPLSSQQIETMVGRYQQRYLRYRSEVIARTEALSAVHEGNNLMFQQAVDNGTLDGTKLERRWNTALDERVRGSHRKMHAQRKPGVQEPFVSGLGNQLRYPGDKAAPPEDTIQCRCAVGTTFVGAIG